MNLLEIVPFWTICVIGVIMLSPITNTTQAQPTASLHRSTTSTDKSAQSKPPSSVAGSDTAQLSSAAQAALAAMKEATETPAQTAREAGGGDVQAQRLLAKEVAAKTAEK